MPISIEEVKTFIEDAKRCRESWLAVANSSWAEIKKKKSSQRPDKDAPSSLWSVTPNTLRRRSRYPAWYSIFKIRQPLVLSRVGTPICKDLTQDGNDPIGATAAILKERLAVNLPRTFNFFEVLCAARDDALITNVGQLRAYYERDTVKERVKERLSAEVLEATGETMLLDTSGNSIPLDQALQDDEGYYIERDEIVDVENEKVCLEPVLYRDFLVDPDVRFWWQVKRIAFAEHYSPREFERIFGKASLLTLPKDYAEGDNNAADKRRYITVFEYWDKYEKDCKWFVDGGTDFIRPKGYYEPDKYEEGEQPNGLYDLEGFYPCPEPLVFNKTTDEFWPTPEFLQITEILDDIHNIFSRMVSATRSIRNRLLFDAGVDSLQALINEAMEGDAIGVPNLAQSLNSAGGSLDAVVQYIPVGPVIESLNQLYTALEQRLNTLYKLTGTSDLLQGLITDPTQRTFGERQMTEKYALNQIAEPQRKMAEFVRNCYELLCEVALKNFNDASLDKYIMPQTLQPEDQQRYQAALSLLKNDWKRFRVDLETDSTIALNEEFDKNARIELVNVLTTALEKTANIAQTTPALVQTELHCLKYLIQGFRQGKLFQSEVTQAIDNVIEAAGQIDTSQAFNKDEAALALKREEIAANNQLEAARIASSERLEMAKLQQNDTVLAIKSQLDSLKTQSEQMQAQADLKLKYDQLQADIALQQQELALKREELLTKMQELASKNEVAQMQLALEGRSALMDEQYTGLQAQIEQADLQLRASQQELEQQRMELDLQERYLTEQRLQSEQKLKEMESQLKLASQMVQMQQPPAQPAPNINIAMPTPKLPKKSTKVKTNPLGQVVGVEESTEIGGVKSKTKVEEDEQGNVTRVDEEEG